MNNEIKKLEKKIKNAGRLEKFFDKFSDKIADVKCGAAIGFVLLMLATRFITESFYYIFGLLGLASAIDLIVESQTNYGENISDGISQKYRSRKRDLEIEKASLESENFQSINKDELKKAQKELGLDNSVVIEKTTTKYDMTIEVEKE